MKWFLVVMLINGWGSSWKEFDFPDEASCYKALEKMKAPINPQADMKGNYSYAFCAPRKEAK